MFNWFKKKVVTIKLDSVDNLYKFEIYHAAEKVEYEVAIDRGTPSTTIDVIWGRLNEAAKKVAHSGRYELKFLIRKDLAVHVADDLRRWRQFEGVIETF